MNEYNSIVNEYHGIQRPILDDKSKSDNKQFSTAKKRSPVNIPKGKVTSSTNHKNDGSYIVDSKKEEEKQGRISKFILPVETGTGPI